MLKVEFKRFRLLDLRVPSYGIIFTTFDSLIAFIDFFKITPKHNAYILSPLPRYA